MGTALEDVLGDALKNTEEVGKPSGDVDQSTCIPAKWATEMGRPAARNSSTMPR
jgi:hypothetical protein